MLQKNRGALRIDATSLELLDVAYENHQSLGSMFVEVYLFNHIHVYVIKTKHMELYCKLYVKEIIICVVFSLESA